MNNIFRMHQHHRQMLFLPCLLVFSYIAVALMPSFACAEDKGVLLEEKFDNAPAWKHIFDKADWKVVDGEFRCGGDHSVSGRLLPVGPLADVIIEADVRVLDPQRRSNFGFFMRMQDDKSGLAVRHYDSKKHLEVLSYHRGQATTVPGGEKVSIQPGKAYRMKAALVGNMLLAKLYPAGDKEPPWQLVTQYDKGKPGRVGIFAEDGSQVGFSNVRVKGGPAIARLKGELAEERKRMTQRLRDELKLEVRVEPLVFRTDKGPRREIYVRTVFRDKPYPAEGKLHGTYGDEKIVRTLSPEFHTSRGYPLPLPDPEQGQSKKLTLRFEADFGKTLTCEADIKSARRWKIFMNPHTHYDIGFTHPQQEIIDRLAHDMTKAIRYCDETADYPPESRYRWTVEVTGLMKNFVERYPELVDKLIKYVREGRIEICGFYLNMPTEVVGHEELIRCLYYAQRLRDKYGITIDTAQINDVPGYTWALADLLPQAGIHRVSLRANSIRGNFLWYREGAIKRPFYWQGPAGGKVFMWYTDTYRDGNFFRSPGLHEGSFLSNIRRNEATGYKFDYIQLRMGGDNLPPDLNTSKNAKAWNDKYVWPKVIVSTNREFLEPLERDYGKQCKTFRGDIPSWWADGPVSAADENGTVRLLHDELVATEAAWTLSRLLDSDISYPRNKIDLAYDRMIHFDEHTWGASGSISKPTSLDTRTQWSFKKSFADSGKRLGDKLRDGAVDALSAAINKDSSAKKSKNSTSRFVALFNSLAWQRSDLVKLRLDTAPLVFTAGVRVVDTRTGKPVVVQMSRDGQTAYFVAENLPSLGYAVFEISPASTAGPTRHKPDPLLENDFYRIEADPKAGGLVSWRDKQFNRELIDRKAKYLANQPIYERSLDGRDAISKKRPTRFKRTVPSDGKIVGRDSGPVFDELVMETSLPSVPKIRQSIRLYHGLKMIDIENLVEKQEVFEPEGLYFAFPFDIPKPTMRVQIADASMRLGIDQLTYTCQDFFAIQHWLDAAPTDAGENSVGVIWAPLECPLITAGGMNAYQWADKIDFSKAHVFSWVMNNYWICNFKNGQSGTTPLRYRMTSYKGKQDPVRATRFAWQPFQPPVAVWLDQKPSSASWSFLKVEGDPVIVSCLKTSETSGDLIVRVLEMQGKAAQATLRINPPRGKKVAQAYLANCLEVERGALPVENGSVKLELKPNEIMTVGLKVE